MRDLEDAHLTSPVSDPEYSQSLATYLLWLPVSGVAELLLTPPATTGMRENCEAKGSCLLAGVESDCAA